MNTRHFGFGILVLGVLFGGCCEEKNYYNEIESATIVNSVKDMALPDSSEVAGSRFRINILLQSITIAKYTPSFFIQKSYAFSCYNNYMGLKKKVTKFELTCDKDILGIQAGKDLSKYLIFYYAYNNPQEAGITKEVYLDKVNNQEHFYNFTMRFSEKILSDEYLKFYLHIELADSTALKSQTDYVKIIK